MTYKEWLLGQIVSGLASNPSLINTELFCSSDDFCRIALLITNSLINKLENEGLNLIGEISSEVQTDIK